MYINEDFIDLGLTDGQEFPTESHRKICENIILGNSNVNTMDKLVEIVQAVIKIPNDRIETITINDIINEFGIEF